jgi:U4/U6 small nuclear ribonucleoprotein PRP31
METKNRRGGKRIRRLKERFEETDLMKQANRRGFASGVGEYGDDSMGLTLGMLDSKQGTGNARSLLETAEKRKMRQADSKASRKRATQASWNASRHGGTVSGMASSMSFTPVQGLELVNPDANKQRVRDANRKWFEDNAGFQSALPRSNH